MITRARVFGHGADVPFAAVIFLAVAVTVASLTGAALGGLGQLLGTPARVLFAAIALVGITAVALSHRGPWQLERETNLEWLLLADWRTAVYNAASLSVGFATRIGFWSFFLVPVGAFMTADARTGALVYAGYAATRTLASFTLGAVSLRSTRVIEAVQRSHGLMRSVSDAALFAGVGYLLGAIAPA